MQLALVLTVLLLFQLMPSLYKDTCSLGYKKWSGNFDRRFKRYIVTEANTWQRPGSFVAPPGGGKVLIISLRCRRCVPELCALKNAADIGTLILVIRIVKYRVDISSV